MTQPAFPGLPIIAAAVLLGAYVLPGYGAIYPGDIHPFGHGFVGFIDPDGFTDVIVTGMLEVNEEGQLEGGTVFSADDVTFAVEADFLLASLENWGLAHFSGVDLAEPTEEATVWGGGANPDGDDLNNDGEFGLGTDPNDPTDGDGGVSFGTASEGGEALLFQDSFGVNVFSVRFDNTMTWQTVLAAAFAQDSIQSAVIVTFSDGGALEQGYYHLFYTTIDLDDYGYASGASISGLNIRGPALSGVPDNNFLDAVAVANLNAPPPTPLEAWRATHFSAADLGDPAKEATVWGNGADPDGDGASNWYEYVFGDVPTVSDALAIEIGVAVVYESGDAFLQFSFNRRTNDPSLVYSPKVSSEAQSWNGDSGHVVETGIVTLNSAFERVTIVDLGAGAGGGRAFGRVEVSTNNL